MDNRKHINNNKIVNIEDLSLNHIIALNEISISIIEDFNIFTHSLYKLSDKSHVWKFSSLLSRNPYQSKLFLQFSYLIFIKNILDQDSNIKGFIVPTLELKVIVKKYIKSKNLSVNVRLSKKRNLKKYIKKLIEPFKHALYTIFISWQLIISSNKKRRLKVSNNNKSITLIDTFILPNSISAGKYIDRYYTGLIDLLDPIEKENIYFVPTIDGGYKTKDIKRIYSNSEENLLFKQDFLKLKDYFISFYKLFNWSPIKKQNIVFRDIDVYLLIEKEFTITRFNVSTFLGLLNFLFFKRVSECDIDIKLAVNWFENQPIDKGFNLGMNTFYPNTASIGYKGYIISEDFNFYVNPTKYEVENGLIPKEINVIGKGLINSSKSYCKEIKVNIAPGFRFNDIWNRKKLTENKTNKIIILVALPIAFKESLEIVRLVFNANKRGFFTNLIFHFKPHPVLNFDDIKSHFGSLWPDNFVQVSGEFHDRLELSNILLGNTSSTCMEALGRGIPVVIIGSQSNLTQNPISSEIPKKIWNIAYTAEELIKHMQYFLNLNHIELEELSAIGESIKKDYFEALTKENARKFLKIK